MNYSDYSAAVEAVRTAAELCRNAQHQLAQNSTLIKADASPVTVADFAAQAVVAAALTERLGHVEIVGEESEDELRNDEAELTRNVVDLVSAARTAPTTATEVRDWISLGGAAGTSERYWTLDPIDGTKGFLRGDQYAVALALVEGGEVVLGVLGCPNLPNPDGSRGAIFSAAGGRCEAWYGDSSAPVDIRVADVNDLTFAIVVESVEAGHSDHGHAAEIVRRLGISTEPYRIDSQCKYAAVARGDASIYLRLPTKASYREKVWDHAAGKFIVEQAGGRVSDVTGAPLDFGHGRTLAANRGVVATSGAIHDEVITAVRAVLDPA